MFQFLRIKINLYILLSKFRKVIIFLNIVTSKQKYLVLLSLNLQYRFQKLVLLSLPKRTVESSMCVLLYVGVCIPFLYSVYVYVCGGRVGMGSSGQVVVPWALIF